MTVRLWCLRLDQPTTMFDLGRSRLGETLRYYHKVALLGLDDTSLRHKKEVEAVVCNRWETASPLLDVYCSEKRVGNSEAETSYSAHGNP